MDAEEGHAEEDAGIGGSLEPEPPGDAGVEQVGRCL